MAKDTTVVVTGVSSFVGAHLAIHFAREGARVVGTIASENATRNQTQLQRLESVRGAGADIAALDITHGECLEAFVRRTRPNIWIHHAGWAQAYGSEDYDLDRGNAVNVAPLGRLYASLRDNGCGGVILTGSSAEYGDSDVASREDDACVPRMPYGLSKLSATIRARQLALRFGMATRVARVFIPFGELDAPTKLLPSATMALSKGEAIALSPCDQLRDFLGIHDLVRGYSALVEDLSREGLFDIFNLCSGSPIPVRTVLLAIAELLSANPTLLRFGVKAMREGEAPVCFGSCEKAYHVLRWEPSDFRANLRKYVLGLAPARASARW